MKKFPPVIILEDKSDFCAPQRVVCGKTLLQWQQENLTAHKFERVITAKIKGSDLETILTTYRENFPNAEEFLVIRATAAPLGFLLEEMTGFTAEAVIAGIKAESENNFPGERPLSTVATVRQGRIRKIVARATTVSSESRELLEIYKLSKNFLRFARKQLRVAREIKYGTVGAEIELTLGSASPSLIDILSLFTCDHVLKICEVTRGTVDRCTVAGDFWRLAKNLLTTLPMTVGEEVKISPTAVLKGRVILANQVVIDDFAVIDGPVYLGAGAYVGRFCNILPEAIIEAGARIEAYTELKQSLVPADSIVSSRSTLHKQMLEN